MQNHFRVEVRSEGSASILMLIGELDLASSTALEQELDRAMEPGRNAVILDLRELEFMDSTGLSVLVKAHQRAEEAGTEFGLVKGPAQVQRLLSLTGVADRLRFADAPEELLGSE
ncbi:MAG: STAS domain-containing protein [Solirubrobacterales bacterium]|nr:STAS domain-containing protein [Solirubrobacterales bacterium]